ncbi:conserved hypothetical protein [Theileria equi strain WA]|uniref:TATA box binding protein associated factor (TAF) histone-like fold domain-containing protein n=1 Tax=Theileria equi strain WA TaxID=1537102 RepID=L1LD89_THEEQ|nr:conserved hypothetical protein [Theileria equi strain WA]EKX73239.1 conserved hypothetical protein [Theileria equi strain WA]|eukprot:XP_004832691.1 conserved hypothetical protein [Theileria equi strain WA]
MALSKTHPLFQNDKLALSPEAAELIANTVEFRIKQIVQMARKFLIHSSRPAQTSFLLPIDVRNALRTLKIEDLDGYSNCYDYRYVCSTKLFKGDRVIKRESCYRNSLGDKCWGRYRLSDIIQQDMQKAVPAAPGLTVHWMVVNGRVPTISGSLVECITDEFEERAKKMALQHKVHKINFLDYSETSESLDSLQTLLKDLKSSKSGLKDSLSDNVLEKGLVEALYKQTVEDKTTSKQSKVILPKIDHLLTKEHRFFLKEIRNMVRRASYSMEPEVQNQFKKVVGILRSSMALDQLLPELCHFFVTEMSRYKSNPSSIAVSVLLEYVEAITSNKNIQIHHHIHQLLTPLLELILGPDESNLPFIYRGLLIRKCAAQALGNIAANLRQSQNGLESIDDYLMSLYKCEILNDKCSLSVLYGALCGIAKLPLLAKRIVFYPLVPLLLSVVVKKQRAIYTHSFTDPKQQKIRQFKIIVCHEVIHLMMEIIYDAGFEDVLSTLEDTGVLLTISHQAKTMVNETLLGCVNASINPELFIPVYTAMLCKCFSVLNKPEKISSLKRKYEEIAVSEQENKPNEIYTISVIKNYVKNYERDNNNATELYASEYPVSCSKKGTWYNNQAVHLLTLMI